MELNNIDRVLIFQERSSGVLTLQQLRARYDIEPDGTNFYFGINAVNVDNFTKTGSALNPWDKAFFAAFLESLLASSADEKILMLGLEPSEPIGTYAFVAAHLDLLTSLAKELDELQQDARASGKRLQIAIRYASEMNDGSQVQGRDIDGYKQTFVKVREVFTKLAPAIPFSFSPALRADLPQDLITQYWPGDAYVDIIGGTWYIGDTGQRAASTANMQAYFLQRLGAARSFALSEVGGCESSGVNAAGQDVGQGNDAMLEDMLHQMEALQIRGVSFKYATLFLAGKWGSDATLAFLRT